MLYPYSPWWAVWGPLGDRRHVTCSHRSTPGVALQHTASSGQAMETRCRKREGQGPGVSSGPLPLRGTVYTCSSPATVSGGERPQERPRRGACRTHLPAQGLQSTPVFLHKMGRGERDLDL